MARPDASGHRAGRENPPGANRFDREVLDAVAGQGPLRGVVTALENANCEAVLIVTVDMPVITPEQLLWLADALQERPGCFGLMTSHDESGKLVIEPFPSIYRPAAISVIHERLAHGDRSVHRLLGDQRFALFPAPPQWTAAGVWANLNTPEDLAGMQPHL